ncbi:MAG: flagellar basal body rod protein FlgB [Deltaproteobacteria bacterium]|jgi:flagellar basal-body rod protein FlgB|nr:flagellar basal body rod protein FlgB [Deltaproteobacteria bacterium]MDA8308669.1 flagellar basal body rod protein FlgB [Deltaproteobacteria bacterium]
MNNGIIFDKTMQMIEDRLSLSSTNQKLISSNLANIDTPGYKTKSLSFEDTLRQSLENHVLQMVRTNSRDLDPDDPVEAMQNATVVEGGPVDLDTQMVNLAKNSIEFQYMIALLDKKFGLLKTAITG